MADAVAVVNDLIFSTKITGTAGALGIDAKAVANPDALGKLLDDGGVRLVMVDMALSTEIATRSLQRAAAHHPKPETLAFYSHVQAELAESAKDAGATITMPRSQFTAALPELLKRYCEPRET